MSDDDLEKLAAAMKNISPSKAAREAGMNAAMAAFDAEFTAENVHAKETAKEKISTPDQGLAHAPRPTGQTSYVGYAASLGRETMSKISQFFKQPKAMMMMGTCAAALFATSLYVPNMRFEETLSVTPAVDEVAADVDKTDEITVTAKRTEESAPVGQTVVVEDKVVQDIAASPAPVTVAPPAPAPAIAPPPPAIERQAAAVDAQPKAQGGLSSVNELLRKVGTENTELSTRNRGQDAKFRQRRDKQASLIADAQSRPAMRIGNPRSTAPSVQGQQALGYADASSVPMVEKQVTRRVIKTPASTQERSVPAITKMETRRVRQEDGTYKTVMDTVVVQESSTELVTIPPTYETITETIMVPANDKFEKAEANPVVSAKETPVSTFSVDVDTASYSFFRSSINRGQLPPRSSIRLEEMINYFPYDYEAPRSVDEPFKANVTVTPNPWNADTKLMHIGIKGYVPDMDEKPKSNIVFLIDTSGSMRAANKLPLLISSFKLLLSTLDEDDTVSIVTYAGSAGTVLEPTAASDKNKIKEALNNLRAGGSTAGAAGLELAYIKAQENFDEDGVNRVILATDGDFNVGFSSPDEMKTYIEDKRDTGIFLSVLGFGNGNYNDHLMQSLAQNGNGVAAYIDTLAEANKVLANESGSALITIAKDVKIQVEFNPETISEYRLIGYETRALKRQDFNNDKVDAGEINSGHTVTAIYEMTPVGSPAQVIDDLRYASDAVLGNGSDEFAFVKIRHKLPNANTSTLQTVAIGPKQERSLSRASDDMRFATAVAAVGQKLRGDTQLADFSYEDAIKLATEAKGKDEHGYRAEFIQLVRLADTLSD